MPGNPSGQLAAATGIGTLRWLVTLYRRDQRPGPDGAIAENLARIGDTHADIQPTYASTFYQSTQVDSPITHMINIRWADYPPTIDVIVRTTLWPTKRTELYRVRRTKEVAGRKRFLQMECELEHSRDDVPDDTDATRDAFLTEPYSNPTEWDQGETIWDEGKTFWDSPSR